MFTKSSKVKCPYCLRSEVKSDYRFICDECGAVYPSYLTKHICSKNGCTGRLMLECPNCKERIPDSYFDYSKYMNVCIVGNCNSGKSNYIPIMIEELRRTLGSSLFISEMNSFTKEYYRYYRNLLYVHNCVQPASARGTMNTLLFGITDNGNESNDSHYPTYCLTLKDTAGEDWVGHESIGLIRKTLADCDYILYFIDSDRLVNSTTNGYILLDEISDLADNIREGSSYSYSQKIDKSIVFVISKFDKLIDSISYRPNDYSNDFVYDLSDVNALNDKIESLIISTGNEKMLQIIKSQFSDYVFMGVSSFGCNPDANDQISEIKPFRVLDPILWIFNKEQIL